MPIKKISKDISTFAGWADIAGGSHKLSIIAKANGHLDSDPTDLTIEKPLPKLDIPTGLSVTGTTVTWTAVTNATSYGIKVDAIDFGTVTGTTYDLSTNVKWTNVSNGQHTVYITAKATAYLGSDFANITISRTDAKLAIPKNLSSDGSRIIFDKVANAERYSICVQTNPVVDFGEIKNPNLLGRYVFNETPKGNIFTSTVSTGFTCSFEVGAHYDTRKGTDLGVVNKNISYWIDTQYGPKLVYAYINGKWSSGGADKNILFYDTNSLTNADKLSEFLLENAVKDKPNSVDIDLSFMKNWEQIVDGRHSLTVVAKADGYIDSDEASVDFVKGLIYLDKPTGYTMDGTVLKWNPVPYATSYTVLLDEPGIAVHVGTYTTKETTFDISKRQEWIDAPNGEYNIGVYATAPGYQRSQSVWETILKGKGKSPVFDTIIPFEDENGKPIITARNELGEVLAVKPFHDLISCNFKDIEKASVEIRKTFEEVITDLDEAKYLSELTPDITDIIKDMKLDVPIESIRVWNENVFYINLPETINDSIATEGNTVTLRFKGNIEESSWIIAIERGADGKYSCVPAEGITYDYVNGTIDVMCFGYNSFNNNSFDAIMFATDIR